MPVVKHVIGASSEGLSFRCPGCNERHYVQTSGAGQNWLWNGSLEEPTLRPSLLITSGHYIPGNGCWCQYNAEHPEKPAPFTCFICHSFVTNGRIQFLGDCTHALAGQTVDLSTLSNDEVG